MQKQTFTFTDPEGVEIFVYKWLPEGEVKAVLQVAHGMVERASRYERLAEVLTKEGYALYVNDHRGHGMTAKTVEEVGHISSDGFEWMVKDLHQLTCIINDENPGKPVFLLGQSMGSFLVQTYIAIYGKELKGASLFGTTGKQKNLSSGVFLANMGKKFSGEKTRSYRIDKISFGGFNKQFAPNRTPFDWLSRDPDEVDKYINDPFCGVVCTTSFYHSLFKGMLKMHKDEFMEKIPKELPIYIAGGTMDPVSSNAATVKWLIEKYKSMGIKDVTYNLYDGGRHEMLNEINRDEVTLNLLNWLNSHL